MSAYQVGSLFFSPKTKNHPLILLNRNNGRYAHIDLNDILEINNNQYITATAIEYAKYVMAVSALLDEDLVIMNILTAQSNQLSKLHRQEDGSYCLINSPLGTNDVSLAEVTVLNLGTLQRISLREAAEQKEEVFSYRQLIGLDEITHGAENPFSPPIAAPNI